MAKFLLLEGGQNSHRLAEEIDTGGGNKFDGWGMDQTIDVENSSYTLENVI